MKTAHTLSLFLNMLLLLKMAIPRKILHNETKKGVCLSANSPATFQCGDIEALNGISWYYDWHYTNRYIKYGCGSEPSGYVPMIRRWKGKIKLPNIPSRYTTLLGFNEPYNHNEEPETIASAWLALMERYPNKTLVGPSCGTDETGQRWLSQFMAMCESLSCRIDYLALHSYSSSIDEDFKTYKKLYSRYGKKIWLTEFAKARTNDVSVVFEHIENYLQQLEESHVIYRYSWYKTRYDRNHTGADGWYLNSVNSLFDIHSQNITDVGRKYIATGPIKTFSPELGTKEADTSYNTSLIEVFVKIEVI